MTHLIDTISTVHFLDIFHRKCKVFASVTKTGKFGPKRSQPDLFTLPHALEAFPTCPEYDSYGNIENGSAGLVKATLSDPTCDVLQSFIEVEGAYPTRSRFLYDLCKRRFLVPDSNDYTHVSSTSSKSVQISLNVAEP